MGTFQVDCKLVNLTERSRSFETTAMVDTGSEFTWAPSAFLEQIGVEREKKDLTLRGISDRSTFSQAPCVASAGR